MSDAQKLPLELIFHIISSLLGDQRTILHPSHSATKALLSFTLVCRATYPVASNYLRQHCVYINNDRRLRDLIYCAESTGGRIRGRHNATPVDPSTSLPLLSDTTPLRPITALHLAPFRGSIDDQPTAIWTRELFCLIHPHVTRLVIDIPLRSLYPAGDHLSVRKTLREAFSLLTGIEEFVSVRDELYLDILEPDWRTEMEVQVWTLWPRLRRLALYNVDANDHFWRAVRRMRSLETVVITRADSLEVSCIKTGYLSTVSTDTGTGAGDGETTTTEVQAEGRNTDGDFESPRPLKVVIVNIENHQPGNIAGRWKWDKVDPGHIVKIMKYNVPTSFYGDESPIDLCQEWVKTAALNGKIWDWEGPVIQQGPRGEEQVFELEA